MWSGTRPGSTSFPRTVRDGSEGNEVYIPLGSAVPGIEASGGTCSTSPP